MFSGGLDSYAGVKWLLDKNIEPILVSHCGQNKICRVQSLLSEKINNICGKELAFYQISARAKLGKNKAQLEYSQRARSFLFFSLATLFALEIGTNQIFVFENGILAINIPITQARVYGNTRTTHPDFVSKYMNLILRIFSIEISIENPFLYMTKGEAISVLNTPDFKTLIKDTISCSQLGVLRYKGVSINTTSHCGECLPCVLRRTAIRHSNFDKSDAQYYRDITGDPDDMSDQGKRIYYELKDFCHKLNSCKDNIDVLLKYPQFYIESANVPSLIDMYRRYAIEVDNILA